MGLSVTAGGVSLLRAYNAQRHRMPQANFPETFQRWRDLENLVDSYDVFLFDAFGVLNVGDTPLPGAARRLEALRALGKRVMLVSNAASLPQADLVAKYQRLGMGFAPEDVVSSRVALVQALAVFSAHFSAQAANFQWGVMAPAGSNLSDFPGQSLLLGDDPDVYERFDGCVLLASSGWTDQRQKLLVQALRTQPRPIWVGNPDLVAPREHGFSLEPGWFAADLAQQGTGVQRMFGKPFPAVFELAQSRWADVPQARVLMVGDTLHTDILGGRAMGYDTALVVGPGAASHGLDLEAACAESGIVPQHVIESI